MTLVYPQYNARHIFIFALKLFSSNEQVNTNIKIVVVADDHLKHNLFNVCIALVRRGMTNTR